MSDVSDEGNDTPTERTAIKRSVQQTASPLRSSWYREKRYGIALLAQCGFCALYMSRVIFTNAITTITTNETITTDNGTVIMPAEFDWNSEIQEVILSSFYYGYILSQIPGGYLATVYGGKNVFGVGVAVSSVFTLLTPLFTEYSLYLLVMARVMKGFFEGVTYPAMLAFWLRWAPPLERSKLTMVSFSGAYFGIAASLAYIIYFRHNWTYNLFIFGLLTYSFSTVWLYFVKSKPQDELKIPQHEICYMRSSLGNPFPFVKNFPVPWKKIFLSRPVWAIIIAHLCENWGFYTLLRELPTFMKDVFEYEVDKSGWLLTLPYLTSYACLTLSGLAADSLQCRQILSTVRVRKLFTCTGFLLQTVFLFMAARTASPIAFALYLTAGMGLGRIAWSGFGVNHLDLAPPYASILMGISNTFATLPAIISPFVTGFLVQHKSHEEWQTVLHISSVFYFVGAIFYGLFASSEEQSWAQIESIFDDNLSFGEVTGE